MNKFLDEGNLQFDFSAFQSVKRFDDNKINAYGMKAVDFIAEDNDYLYFIETKDFQHPKATPERRNEDYEILNEAVKNKKSVFTIEMGVKIKDSLLRRYSEGEVFTKKVIYLLVINHDKLGEFERGLLMTKVNNHIPKGLNDNRFPAFTSIEFDLVNIEQLKNYKIFCTTKSGG